VVAQNDTRRHLDTSQRALIAARMANLKRGGLRNPSGNNQYETKEVKAQRCALTSDETPPLVSTKRAASLLKVGERTVDRAKRVIESNNQDAKRRKSGFLTFPSRFVSDSCGSERRTFNDLRTAKRPKWAFCDNLRKRCRGFPR
jgi:hypothetical protein